MCGIICAIGDAAGADAASADDRGIERFRAARDLMTSRGPDGAGEAFLSDPRAGRVWLGHRRLAILDLSDAGAQPMWSDCGRYAIVYNGEIYNAFELRARLEQRGRRFASRCDTEAIVNGYAEWGPRVVEELRGMFAFAIWDQREGELFAARDRVGVKPLSYVATPRGLALASDARALAALGLTRDLDLDALGAYLALGYVPAPLSIWRGVAKLPAGSTLVWRPGAAPRVSTYWAPPDATDSDSGSGGLDALEELLDTVVREHLLSDVPIGLFLSGGLDSSVVASSAVRTLRARGGSADLTGMTIAFPASPHDEAPAARRTADALGLEWRMSALDRSNTEEHFAPAFAALDEPIGFSAIVSQAAISALAAREFKVVLSGDGGDEVFGGYRWYDGVGAAEKTGPAARSRPLPFAAIGDRLVSIVAPGRARRVRARADTAAFAARSPLHRHMRRVFGAFRPEEIGEFVDGLSPARAEEAALDALRRHDAPNLPMKRRLQRIDLMTFCQDAVLAKVDRTAMAFGLEVRPPLLDHRLVEWGLSRPISPDYDAEPKAALRRILEKRGLGFLLQEPKLGFSLKKASPLSGAGMRRAMLRTPAEKMRPLRPAWSSVLAPRSHGFGAKSQVLYYFTQWREAAGSRADQATPAVSDAKLGVVQ